MPKSRCATAVRGAGLVPAAEEPARRRADRTFDHGGERAGAGVTQVGGDHRHRHAACSQCQRTRQQDLLSPGPEAAAQLLPEQARHGAGAGARLGGPAVQGGMPGRLGDDGFAQCPQPLVDREVDAQARIVLMSGYSEQEATKQSANPQLDGFLEKPFTMATLLAMVRQVVSADQG